MFSNSWNIAQFLAVIFAFGKDSVCVRASFDKDVVERSAIFEGASGKLLQREGNMYAFELGTAVKCLIADPLDAVGQVDITQSHATEKRAVVDLSERGGQFDAVQIFTFEKRISAYDGNGVAHKDLGQMHTRGKGVRLQNLHAVRNADLLQKGTVDERSRTDRADGDPEDLARYLDAGKQRVFIARDDDTVFGFLKSERNISALPRFLDHNHSVFGKLSAGN